jgi:predicted nuclease of restriction endonuclease-like (RecB) superfamily
MQIYLVRRQYVLSDNLLAYHADSRVFDHISYKIMFEEDTMTKNIINQEYNKFLSALKERVASSRHKAALSVNRELILLYHHIGTQILEAQERQGWGTKIIQKLSKDLRSEFPDMKGFSPQNLKYMRKFSEEYRVDEIGQQAVDQIPWGHIVTLIYGISTKDERSFYIQGTLNNGWSRNILSMQIETNLFKRQGNAVTNFGDKLLSPQSDLAQNTLKNPYLFDFLSLGKNSHEREIEKELVAHIEKFLLELGEGFAFLGRQYHLQIEDQDFYIDLLFYHIKLRSFVVIELKTGKFKPEYAGKMNFYLSAVDELLRQPGDNPSIGLILCRSKVGVVAEYALRDMTKPIGLAEYRLQDALPENLKIALPTIEELEAELAKDLVGEDG